MIKRLYAYITGKSIKQRIYISIALTAVLTLTFFTIKGNFFDAHETAVTIQTEISESGETSTIGESKEENPPAETSPPSFRVSLIDIGVLLAVVGAYCVHKYREKKKQGRL